MLFFLCFTNVYYSHTPTNIAYTVTLSAGEYVVHCYGAQGGTGYEGGKPANSTGGRGAHVYGTMKVAGAGTTFYVYVGGEGKTGPNSGGTHLGGAGGKVMSLKSGTVASGEAEERRKYGFRRMICVIASWLPLEAREVQENATELPVATLLATSQLPTTNLCQLQELLTKTTAERTVRAVLEKTELELLEAVEAVDTLAA